MVTVKNMQIFLIFRKLFIKINMTPEKCLNTKLLEFEWAVKSQGHNPLRIECPLWSDSSYFWL